MDTGIMAYNIGDMLKYDVLGESRYCVIISIVNIVSEKKPIFKIFFLKESHYGHVYAEGTFIKRCEKVA